MVYNPKLKREIPEGWEFKPLKDVLQHINTGLNPRNNFVFGGDIKYITVKNLTTNGYIDFSSCDTINEDARKKVHKRSQIAIGDILYASICPLGRTYLITEEPNDWDINESVFSIRPNTDKITSEYLNMLLKDEYYISKLSKSSTGSIFLGIRIKQLEATYILLPKMDIQTKFSQKFKHIFKLQANNFNEIASLTKQRDELLPLLMNGQVSVK
jgi:type I restriction enzyme S subunit